MLPLSAHAKQSEWVVSDNTRARILSGVKAIGTEDTFEAAIELELAKGWHTYWKHPGDTGLPPRFEWKESKNVKGLEIFWPKPKRKNEFDMFTVFAYEDKVIFPLLVRLEQPAKQTALNIDLQLMVCKDICIPEQLKLGLELEAGKETAPAQQKRITFAKQKVPKTQDIPDITIDKVIAAPDALVLSAQMKNGFKEAQIFVYTQELAFTAKPIIEADKQDKHKAMIKIPKPESIENVSEFLSGKNVEIILSDGKNSIEKNMAF